MGRCRLLTDSLRPTRCLCHVYHHVTYFACLVCVPGRLGVKLVSFYVF
jgi:hypothetical protein